MRKGFLGTYCGWETSSGQKWGAIWRFNPSDVFESEFYTPTSEKRGFTLPSNSSGYIVEQYQISITSSTPTLQSSGSDIIVDPGVTTFNVSTTENPTFLKFIPQS